MEPRTPALLIKTSMRPKASQALCTAASRAEPPAATSSSTATARGPSAAAEALISSQSERRRSARRAAATTRQPARARSRQKSRPMPEEAPVTSTTWPSSLLQGGGAPTDVIAGALSREEEGDLGWESEAQRFRATAHLCVRGV